MTETMVLISQLRGAHRPERWCASRRNIHMRFPTEHWLKIRSNNAIERLNREIRRRTRVVGTFPDGNSALMLVCARLRHIESSSWGTKYYMNMRHLDNWELDAELDAG